jgi:hypothetical protein
MSVTKVTYAMIEGAPANVLDFGAVGDGVTDDTVAIQAALDSGASCIVIPQGTYQVTGLEIKSGSLVTNVMGQGLPTIRLITGSNRVALLISKTNFVTVENIYFRSTGDKNDGNSTVGIKATSKSFLTFNNIRALGYSTAGMQLQQVVYVNCYQLTIQSCTYGLSIEAVSSISSTTVSVNSAYITGCTRGINTRGSTNTFKNIVLELCGSSSTTDGAFHITGGGSFLLSPYWEANERNIVADESPLQIIDGFRLTATAPDVITYSAVSFALRGNTQINNNTINTRYLQGDTLSNYDLNIGNNLIAPLTGSVNFGGQTMETVTGSVASGVWTTIKTLTGQSGDGAARKTYRYSVYAGRSDKTTGYDSGIILNGTLYSDSGSTPAWLQMSGSDLQVNITNTTYGLDYGCTFTVIEGIGPP